MKSTPKIVIKTGTLLGIFLLGASHSVPATSAFAVKRDFEVACSPVPSFKRFIQLSRVEVLSGENDEHSYKVYWPVESDEEVASEFQPELGGEFLIARCLPPGRWAIVGRGEISDLNGKLIVANAEAPSAASSFGNQYDRPMVGDVVLPKHVTTEPIARIQPKFEFSVSQLFEKDESLNFTYNLSDQGKETLKKSFEKLKNASGRLLVESYLNREGSRDYLKTESQIRAAAVAQYLAREFDIDESRVIAIGTGSVGLSSGMSSLPRWPQREVLEGVILRVVPR